MNKEKDKQEIIVDFSNTEKSKEADNHADVSEVESQSDTVIDVGQVFKQVIEEQAVEEALPEMTTTVEQRTRRRGVNKKGIRKRESKKQREERESQEQAELTLIQEAARQHEEEKLKEKQAQSRLQISMTIVSMTNLIYSKLDNAAKLTSAEQKQLIECWDTYLESVNVVDIPPGYVLLGINAMILLPRLGYIKKTSAWQKFKSFVLPKRGNKII